MMGKPIASDGNSSTFDLVRKPNGVYCVDGRAIPVADNTAHAAIQVRADELAKWMRENGHACNQEQAHLDTDTQERLYWHYGYLIALRDVLALLNGNCNVLH